MRPTQHDGHRIRQNADPFSHNRRFWSHFAQWVCTVAAAPPQVAASPSPIGGNCTTRGSDTPATRRKKASCSAKPPSPPAWRTPGARRARRSAHEQRQGAAIARQLTQGRRQSTTQLSQQQPRRTPSVQNSPSTSSTAPLPVQNSPRTPTLTACPGQNSPCTPKMARFGAIYACGESFVPLWPPRTRAGRVLYRTQGRVGASHDTTTGTTSAEGTGGTTGTRRMTGGLRQDHRQTNFACNSPTARSNASSKTAEYQRLDFKT